MARVTVEDCLKNVDNRFELVFAATKRARQITKEGVDPLVSWDNDKPTVVALREIAANLLGTKAEEKDIEKDIENTVEDAAEEEDTSDASTAAEAEITAEEIAEVNEELSE